MAILQILAPQQAAVTLPLQETVNYQWVAFAVGTVTTDTVTVKVQLPDGQVSPAGAPDINGVVTGLSAANPVRWYPGGPTYIVAKVGSTDTVGIYMIPGSRVV